MTKEELSKFCAEDNRPIGKPWSAGNYSYATDGFICLRIPRLNDVPEFISAPDASKLFTETAEPEEWFSLPDITLPDPIDCPDCKGRGKEATCPECDGNKIVNLSNCYSDYDVECASCEGAGKLAECEECEGTGKIIPEAAVQIGCAKFSSKFLMRIKDIPGIEIGPVAPEKPALLRFSDGDGVIITSK